MKSIERLSHHGPPSPPPRTGPPDGASAVPDNGITTNHGRPMTSTSNTFGTLCNYHTGDAIRPATSDELLESRDAANADGGAGVIEVDGISCYVEGGDDFIAATDYLYGIGELAWEVGCGNQTREDFAALAIEQGQNIEDAWKEALAHAVSL